MVFLESIVLNKRLRFILHYQGNQQKLWIGRTLRYVPGKETEIFTLVLRGTVEWDWFVKSHSADSYITIDEFNLMNILEGKEYAIKKNKETHKMYWY